jgi:plasmid maintenance system killer protein
VRGWRRLHTKELQNLHDSPNIIMVMKSMRWTEHVACMGDIRNLYKVLFRLDWRLIYDWILGKWWTGIIWFRIMASGRLL